MSKVKKLTTLFLLVIMCFCAGICLQTIPATAESVTDSVSITMVDGAQVRIETDNNGIRFAAIISDEDYSTLQSNYKSVTYGMLISSLKTVNAKGDLSQANVFGANAIYNWAENGKYTAATGKTRITNLTTDQSHLADFELADGYKVIRGSITGILDANLTLQRVARAYVKCVDENDNVTYIFSNYNSNNSRSVVDVADAAIVAGETASEWLIKNYVQRAVNTKVDAFTSIEVADDNLEKLSDAYYELKALTDSLSPSVYSVALSQNQVDEVNDKIDEFSKAEQLTLRDPIVYDTETITTKIEFTESEKYTEAYNFNGVDYKVYAKNDLFAIDITQPDKPCWPAKDSTTLEQNGLSLQTQSDGSSAKHDWKIFLPKIDYSTLSSVSFKYKTGNLLKITIGNSTLKTETTYEIILNAVNSSTIAYAIVNVADATETYSGKVENIEDVVNGTLGFNFDVVGGQYSTSYFSPISKNNITKTAKQQIEVAELDATWFDDIVYNGETYKNVYRTGINELYALNVDDKVGAAVARDQNLSSGGGILQIEATDKNFVIFIPKFNYSNYDKICFDFIVWNTVKNISFGDNLLTISKDVKYNVTLQANGVDSINYTVVNSSTGVQQTGTVSGIANIVSGASGFEIKAVGGEYGRFIVSSFSKITYEKDYGEASSIVEFTGSSRIIDSAQSVVSVNDLSVTRDKDGLGALQVIKSNTKFENGLNIQAQPSSGSANSSSGELYSINLPKINFREYSVVELSIFVQQTKSIGIQNKLLSVVDEDIVTITFMVEGDTLNVTISNGTNSINDSISDINIVNGYSSAAIKVNAQTYNTIEVSPITACDKVSLNYSKLVNVG